MILAVPVFGLPIDVYLFNPLLCSGIKGGGGGGGGGGGVGSALIFVRTQFWDMSWPWWPGHVPIIWE